MSDVDAKKIQQLESNLQRLERLVLQLTRRVDYLERERQRIKNDISQIVGVLRNK